MFSIAPEEGSAEWGTGPVPAAISIVWPPSVGSRLVAGDSVRSAASERKGRQPPKKGSPRFGDRGRRARGGRTRNGRTLPGVAAGQGSDVFSCGAKGSRTPDLVDANDALYQLSYSPVCSSAAP